MKQIDLEELRLDFIYIVFINICLLYDQRNIILMFLIITEILCFSPQQKRHHTDCGGVISLCCPSFSLFSQRVSVMTGDVYRWQDLVWLMIRADHEISNEEERRYHDQLQPVRTILALAVAACLPPVWRFRRLELHSGVVEPEENIQSGYYSFTLGKHTGFTFNI